MTVLTALAMVVLSADPSAGAGWKQAARDEGITVLTRQKDGSDVQEVKAIGLIDASPQKVYAIIRDYPNYKKNMPYTSVSDVVGTADDGKTVYFYSVVDAPFVSKRDYTIKTVDESDWKDGKGFLKVSWKPVTDKGPPVKDGLVRVTVNEGFWLLEPRDNGTKTFATYYLYTHPGGSLPTWIVNKANSSAVPDVFKAIRKLAAKK